MNTDPTIPYPDPAVGEPGVDPAAPDATPTGAADLPTPDPEVGTTGAPPESPDRSVDEGGNSGAPDAELPQVPPVEQADITLISADHNGIEVERPATDVSPGASTGDPSPELRATTPDEVAADHPGLGVDQGAPLGEVPDNPSSAVVDDPNVVDTSIDNPHGWDAGVNELDTGWIRAAALNEAWNDALKGGHGEQDGFIKIPAHLREIEDAVLALANAAVVSIGNVVADTYRVSLDVTEEEGDVRITVRIGRNAGEPAAGATTAATVDANTMAAHLGNTN